jgi:hypothetical protein
MYKRRQPVPVSEMDRSRYEGHHSICQTLRDIYHMSDDEELKMKCRLAMAMAKAMNEQLKRYKELTSNESKDV